MARDYLGCNTIYTVKEQSAQKLIKVNVYLYVLSANKNCEKDCRKDPSWNTKTMKFPSHLNLSWLTYIFVSEGN